MVECRHNGCVNPSGNPHVLTSTPRRLHAANLPSQPVAPDIPSNGHVGAARGPELSKFLKPSTNERDLEGETDK